MWLISVIGWKVGVELRQNCIKLRLHCANEGKMMIDFVVT